MNELVRNAEVITKDIEEMESRLQIAKVNFAEMVIEYMDMGRDVGKHHVPRAYRKVVSDLTKELNELYDERYKAMYPEGR